MRESLSLQYGIGAFETLRVIGGEPEYLGWHLERLMSALKVIGLGNQSLEACRREILHHIQVKGIRRGVVKLVVNDLGRFVTDREIPYGAADYRDGFRLTFSEVEVPGQSRYTIKSTNYLVPLLEWQRAKASGFDDALFVNGRGEIVETTRSNLFLLEKGQLTTPPLSSGCLSGIMRRAIIEAHPAGVREVPVSRGALEDAEAVFLTNAVMGVMPVQSIDGKSYRSADHPKVKALVEEYSMRGHETNG